MARRIIRDFDNDLKTDSDIIGELKHYLESSRPLFLDDQYHKQADYIIDGMASLDLQTSRN